MNDRHLGDVEIQKFRGALANLLGTDPPDALAGDLSDLLWTLERGVALLRGLEGSSNRNEAASMVVGVQSLISDDLPPILRDLGPTLEAAIERIDAE